MANMDTQTFQAREMKEALALVRRQLGPDAIIVSTRKVQNGKMGVFSGHYYEVSAYSENPKGAKTQSGTSKKTQSASMSDDRNLSQPSEQISTGNYHKMKLALNRAKRLSEEPEQPVSRQIEQRPAAAIAAATGPLARVAPHAALRRRLLGALMPRELTERILSQLRTPPSHRAAAERELRHLLVTKTGSPAPLLAPGNRGDR